MASAESVKFLQVISSILFLLAIIHTFFVSKFAMIAHSFPSKSFRHNFFHYLAEIELVFIFWSLIFSIFLFWNLPFSESLNFFRNLSFNEPLFVLVIMLLSSSLPILKLTKKLILSISRLLPMPSLQAQFLVSLFIGPLLGSVVTEPAAMTVIALTVADIFKNHKFSIDFKYAVLAVLLISISIGGTLTHFAAPPVIMVSSNWNLTSTKMFLRFGYKALICILIYVIGLFFYFKKEWQALSSESQTDTSDEFGFIDALVLIMLALTIKYAHSPWILLFIFITTILLSILYKRKMGELKIKSALLVALFLAGLIILGNTQKWWLMDVITQLKNSHLYLTTIALTAVVDNAALTFLGSLTSISEAGKYALLAGAVVGGGLTVIANAPNPIAFNILKIYFEGEEISGLKLLKWAIAPTLIAAILFWYLPNLI